MLSLFSHVGIVVKDIEQALRLWRDSLGLTVVEDMRIPEEGVRSVFLSTGGSYGESTCIELIEPVDGADGPIALWLAAHGEGVFHLAFRGTVSEADVGQLQADGIRTFALPPAGAEVAPRLVIHPKDANGILVELLASDQG